MSDGFAAYEARALSESLKPCVAHLLRNLAAAPSPFQRKEHLQFVEKVIGLLREALALNRQREPSARAYRRAARRPRRPELLAERPTEPSYNDVVRLGQRLEPREHLLAFLHEEEPGTNNQAERDLRSAVITRKTGCVQPRCLGGASPRSSGKHPGHLQEATGADRGLPDRPTAHRRRPAIHPGHPRDSSLTLNKYSCASCVPPYGRWPPVSPVGHGRELTPALEALPDLAP